MADGVGKHSKGPWKVDEVRHAGAYQLVIAESQYAGGFICEVQAPIVDGEFDEATRGANAKLISLAPELAEALRACVDSFGGSDLCMECGEVSGTCAACDTCKVIARAEKILADLAK